jgi:hypothetical protein
MYKPSGRPEDWGSPVGSLWAIQGKPEDWEGPIPSFIVSILRIFYIQ